MDQEVVNFVSFLCHHRNRKKDNKRLIGLGDIFILHNVISLFFQFLGETNKQAAKHGTVTIFIVPPVQSVLMNLLKS